MLVESRTPALAARVLDCGGLKPDKGPHVQGIASILDQRHQAIVEALWLEMEQAFGVREACAAFPHFSYQVAEGYNVAGVVPALRQIAAETAPFSVTTSGLGIFTGDQPVLDIRIVRTAALSRFHERLTTTLDRYTVGEHAHHYGGNSWIPHITLARGDLTHDALPEMVRLLSRRNFNWQIEIDHLCLVLDTRGDRDQWLRFPFGA